MRDIEELYQAIYNQINLVLPEFNFKQKGDVIYYAPKSNGATDYLSLSKEFLEIPKQTK
jgi:hypothetical protein